MTRMFAILFILFSLASTSVQAQSGAGRGTRSAGRDPGTAAQADVTLAEALRQVATRDGSRKGRKLLVWVRQRVEKAANVTHQ